ncbi:hypothetical protein NE237_023232 [Protea cynaroides]|uniref:BZIP domain-containing protein n=1 Tax=Protea cynaroides TaxID=273540 RepID=A0A9Q0HEI7_9MAGN|nr:hypothetical protein NE237_023232 [Protea cynaroides]
MSSSSAPPSNPTRKTMEDVWKDINLASLTDHPSEDLLLSQNNNIRNETTLSSNVGGMIFQDFLSRPLNSNPSSTSTVVSASPPSLAQPAITLNLSSVPDFNLLENLDPFKSRPQFHSHLINAPSPFFFPSNSPIFSPFGSKKRVSDSEDSSGHRRHKRMIKNRESAARSRARKQESLNELEMEIDHLKKEITSLRKEQEHQRQLLQRQSIFGRTAQLPKKDTLYRTSTAPF